MNGKWIKILAVIFMIIDHIGVHLIPDGTLNLILRGIGRIAFPLFAFLLAEGFRHTRNIKKYFLRLLIAALVMEAVVFVIYLITGDNYLISLNVFIPLIFGLFSLWALKQPKWWLKLLVIPLLVLAELLQISYGVYGVLIIIIFGLFSHWTEQLWFIIIVNLFFIEWPLFSLIGIEGNPRYPNLQWLSLLAFIPLFFYNGKKGQYNKWIFYAVYPLHLGIILLLDFLIQ